MRPCAWKAPLRSSTSSRSLKVAGIGLRRKQKTSSRSRRHVRIGRSVAIVAAASTNESAAAALLSLKSMAASLPWGPSLSRTGPQDRPRGGDARRAPSLTSTDPKARNRPWASGWGVSRGDAALTGCWMRTSLAVAVSALIMVGPAAGSAATPTRASEWSHERGDATAAQLIEGCLTATPAARLLERQARVACVDTAFDTCTRENGGTMSQYDLNVCRGFSIRAWRARYDRLLAGFDDVFRAWSRTSDGAWKAATAARFRRQEEDWQRWMRADCEMRELGSVGGTIHSFAVASCEERHIALRTIDLSPVLEWWGSR